MPSGTGRSTISGWVPHGFDEFSLAWDSSLAGRRGESVAARQSRPWQSGCPWVPSACHEVRPCRCGWVRRRVAGASSCRCFLEQHIGGTHGQKRTHRSGTPAAQARHGAYSGRRAGKPPEAAHRHPLQAGRVFRRTLPYYRLRFVELHELGFASHRRAHAVQVAQPAAPPSARLELPQVRDARIRRSHSRAAACRRGVLVPWHGGCRLSESRHHQG